MIYCVEDERNIRGASYLYTGKQQDLKPGGLAMVMN